MHLNALKVYETFSKTFFKKNHFFGMNFPHSPLWQNPRNYIYKYFLLKMNGS
jgi:hypothetical protein